MDNIASLGPDQVACATERHALMSVSFTTYTPATVEIANRMTRTVPVVAITD